MSVCSNGFKVVSISIKTRDWPNHGYNSRLLFDREWNSLRVGMKQIENYLVGLRN